MKREGIRTERPAKRPQRWIQQGMMKTGRMDEHAQELYMFTDGSGVRNFWLGRQEEGARKKVVEAREAP